MQLPPQLVRLFLFSILSYWLSLGPSPLAAQTINVQPLLPPVSLLDSIRFDAMDSLIKKVYWKQAPDTAFALLDELINLLEGAEDNVHYRRAVRRRADLFKAIGDFPAAITAYEQQIAVYKAATYNDERRFRAIALAYRYRAILLRKVGRTSEALEQYEQSLAYAEAAGESGLLRKAQTLNSMGNLYHNLREYELAKEKYTEALEISQTIERDKGIYMALNNLGLVASRMGDYDKAIEYYEISLEMKKAAGDSLLMSNTYGSIGDIYVIQGRLEEAKAYFLLAKDIQENKNRRDELTRSYTQLGDLARLQGQLPEALDWCSKSCAIADEDQLWQARMACHQCLYETQRALGNYQQSLQAYETYIAVRDSVINEENAVEIAELEAKLTYQAELQTASAKQQELAAEARSERLLRWFFFGLAVALAVLSWVVLRIGRQRREQNQLLAEKNQQISDQAAVLEQVANIRSRFFTNISHELRTPLTLVLSPLEHLLSKNKELPQQISSILGTVRNNASKLLGLVEELLELAQLESGTISPAAISIQLPVFIEQIFNNYALLAAEKNINYQLDNSLPTDLIIQTDPARVEKILDNLLSNALKFTPDGGVINLIIENTTTEVGEFIDIHVRDTGPGIAEEDLKYIFDHYYRGAAAQSGDSTVGMGIGLALAWESAQLLGGTLEAESELGQGTNFHFSLPITTSLQASNPASINHLNTAETAPELPVDQRILIVEDNLELQTFLSQMLSNYSCDVADNGAQALKLLEAAQAERSPYHLLLTDLMMPIVDGNELIRQLRSDDRWAALRIVVLSARNQQTEKLNLLRSGVDDFLTKPFSPEELRLRLKKLLQYEINSPLKSEDEPITNTSISNWLKEVEQYIEQSLNTQQDLTASTLSTALHLSNRQLLRKIKATTGLSTQQYIQESKLQLAHRYLVQAKYHSVAEVAKACGFGTTRYFNRVFKERFGKTPREILGT